MRLVIQTKDEWNIHLVNVSDADLKIIYLLNVKIHLKIMINGESKSVSVKEVAVHRKNNAKTLTMAMTKRYMHLWHVCLIMTESLVDISVKVCN